MGKFSEIKKDVLPLIRERFDTLGFKRHSGDQFIYCSTDTYVAQISLLFSGRYGTGHFEVNPLTFVGIPGIFAEEFIKISGKNTLPDAMIIEPLSYLTPKNTFYVWDFGIEDTHKLLDNMFFSIENYAIPYFEKLHNLSGFVEEFKDKGDWSKYALVPIMYYHMQQYDAAREYLEFGYNKYVEHSGFMTYDVDYPDYYEKMKRILEKAPR